MADVLTTQEETGLANVRAAIEGKLADLDSVILRLIKIAGVPRQTLNKLNDLRENLSRAVLDIDQIQKMEQ